MHAVGIIGESLAPLSCYTTNEHLHNHNSTSRYVLVSSVLSDDEYVIVVVDEYYTSFITVLLKKNKIVLFVFKVYEILLCVSMASFLCYSAILVDLMLVLKCGTALALISETLLLLST